MHNHSPVADPGLRDIYIRIIVATIFASVAFVFWLGWPRDIVNPLVAALPWILLAAGSLWIRSQTVSERLIVMAKAIMVSSVTAIGIVTLLLIYPTTVVENHVYYDYHSKVINEWVHNLYYLRSGYR